MKRILLSALTTALPFSFGAHTASKPSVQGTWRTVAVTLPDGRTITNLQPNLTIVTAKHYSRVEVHADAPRPTVPDVNTATADQLRAIWGNFVAEAGTYEINGSVMTMRPLVAKNPAAMATGAFTSYEFTLVGDTVWVTAQATERGPAVDAVKIKAIRV